jgi:hypothetical protein
VCLAVLVLTGCATTHVPRGRDFWLSLEAGGFAVPPGVSADEVFLDSEALLASPDPKLRDDVGYGLSVAWVVRAARVSDEALRGHVARLRARMTAFDDPSPDAVLGRSFAALRLSMVAAAAVKRPLLDDAQRASLLDAAVRALAEERDLRGHDPSLGWIHATAHVADLLKFLVKSPDLKLAQQRLVATAVTQRLARGPAFAWGEDERLAQVLRWLALRPDADTSTIDAWLATLGPQWAAQWKAPALDEAAYTSLNNTRLTLRALLFFLDAEERPTPAVEALRRRVLETVAGLL